jgi:hypothetical protein
MLKFLVSVPIFNKMSNASMESTLILALEIKGIVAKIMVLNPINSNMKYCSCEIVMTFSMHRLTFPLRYFCFSNWN